MTENNWLDPILYLILFFPLFLVIFDSIFRSIFLIIVHLPAKKIIKVGNEKRDLKLLMLVVAHNEQRVIERTLTQIKNQKDKDDSINIAVLADHCSDQTVSIASSMGIEVYVRNEGIPGKGQALSWFAEKKGRLLFNSDIITVLDADTLIDGEFCNKIRIAFKPGMKVVQSFVCPINEDGFHLTTLASFSEILSQEIDDAARSHLLWSIPLKGKGMAFRTEIFQQVCISLVTEVDDIELSFRLAELNIRVHYCPEAKVFDPNTSTVIGLAKQRGRWLKGQRQIWQRIKYNSRGLIWNGLSSYSLVHATLLKPKTAILVINVLLMVILMIMRPGEYLYLILSIVIIYCMLIEILYYLAGLKLVKKRGKYLLALLGAPLFILMWILGWGYSILPGHIWLRGREE